MRAYTNLLLNYGLSERQGWLEMFGFFMDKADGFQVTDTFSGGFFHRANLFSTADGKGENRKYHGKPVFVYSRIFSNFASNPLPLISGVAVRLELSLNPASFYIFTNDSDSAEKQYRLELSDATLLVPVKTLNSGLALSLEKRLQETPITYGLVREEIKKVSIAASLQSYTSDSITQSSVLPDLVLILPIANKIYEGGYGTNPLVCRPSFTYSDGSSTCMDTTTLSVNGTALEQDPVSTPEQLVLVGYKMLHKNLGQLLKAYSCSLEYDVYKKGCFFLLWISWSARGPQTRVCATTPRKEESGCTSDLMPR